MKNFISSANFYRYLALWAVVLLFVVSVTYVYVYSRSVNNYVYRTFSVTGEGKVTVVPDIFKVRWTVVTDKLPEASLKVSDYEVVHTEKMNKIADFLKKSGVKLEDIKTESYNVTPKYKYFDCSKESCREPEVIAYTITQDTSVKVADVELGKEVLKALQSFDLHSVSGLKFEVDDRGKYENLARIEAMKDASIKAKALAEGGRFKLGGLISIYEEFSDAGVSHDMRENQLMKADLVEPEIAELSQTNEFFEGSSEIVVKLNVSYGIRD